MNIIEMQNITKTLGSFHLDLNELNVQQGYITGFIGENGSGKTTTIKLLMNMLFADSGHIRILGMDMPEQATTIKQSIGYMGDQMGYPEKLRLRQLKNCIASFYSKWDEKLYQKYIQHFQLDENKRYSDLSKGMRKQFDLIMALSHHPQLLLLDEPTANLDPLARDQFLDILLDQMDHDDLSVFFSTHITSDLDKVADDIIFLHHGHLLMTDTRDHLLETHRLVRGKSSLLIPEVERTLVHAQRSSFGFEGLCSDWQRTYELLGDEAIYERASLEDIFIHYVARSQDTQKGVLK